MSMAAALLGVWYPMTKSLPDGYAHATPHTPHHTHHATPHWRPPKATWYGMVDSNNRGMVCLIVKHGLSLQCGRTGISREF